MNGQEIKAQKNKFKEKQTEILELKNISNLKKKSLDRLNSRLELKKKKRIKEFEKQVKKSIQTEAKNSQKFKSHPRCMRQ